MEAIKRSIIFTVTNDLTYDQRMHRICATLFDAGYDLTLIGRQKPGSAPLEKKPYKQKRISIWFQRGPLFYLEYNMRLFFLLLFSKADVYSAVDLDTLLAASMASLVRSKKLVFDAHEYFTEVPELHNRNVVKACWSFVANWCIPITHSRYTVSQSLVNVFEEKYHKPFGLIRNVPDAVNVVEHTAQADSPIIFYQGDLNEGRGLEQAIRCMKSINARLHIAGDGPLRKQLMQLAEHEQVTHKVVFMGYLSKTELARQTASATVGLNMLEQYSLSYYYSLSNKFFNYIHAGIPQVCIDFPEYALINSQYEVALLCKLDEEQLCAAIQHLLDDSDLYKRLQQNCQKAALQFNWENEKQTLLAIYEQLFR